MNALDHRLSLIVAGAASALLAGCGGSPSDGDMLKAVQTQAAAERQAFERFAGRGAAGFLQKTQGEIKSVKKIGCKDDGEKAYRCDVEIELQQGGSTHKGPASLRFVKGSDGWAVMK